MHNACSLCVLGLGKEHVFFGVNCSALLSVGTRTDRMRTARSARGDPTAAGLLDVC